MEIWLAKHGTRRIGFETRGKCWRFRFSRMHYYSGKMTYYLFWRFYVVVDRTYERPRDVVIGERIINAIVDGSLIASECPDAPGSPVLHVWRENAAEQIGRLAIEASKRRTA